MNKIFIIYLFVWSTTNVLSSSELAEANNYNDPVTNIMENLVQHTANVAKHLLTELQENTETTYKTLVNNMETVITSALHQLSQPFEDLQKQISSSQCHPKVALEQLKQQVDSDLLKCSQNTEQIVNGLEQNLNQFKTNIEKKIKEITDLREKCKNLNGADFSSHVSCYIENLAVLNQEVANILHDASEIIIHTRQMGEKAVQEERACANEVVTIAKDSFTELLATCSNILEY